MPQIAHVGVIVFALCVMTPESVAAQSSTAQESHDSTRAALIRDIRFLASEKLDGRATGSPGSDSAAEYLAKSYIGMQVDAFLRTTACDSTGACRRTYFQRFQPPATPLQRAGIRDDAVAYNVVAWVPGTDSALRGQYVVIGGHYDHLGRTGYGAREEGGLGRLPHLGADDNASGTAAVLEMARRIANSPIRRPVLFVNFGAEELGLIGSKYFVASSPVAADSMVAMFNFDMVGHLTGGPLQLYGMSSSRDWKRLIDSASAVTRIPLDRHEYASPWSAGSDHAPFDNVGVPIMHFFTGLHEVYHTRLDTAEKLDIDGMIRVLDFAEHLIRLVGDGNRGPVRVGQK